MRIAIVGAGAMGSLYGAKLSQLRETEVILIDVWKEHVNAVNELGLRMDEDGSTITFNNIKAVNDSKEVGTCDLVIIFVKSTMTEKAVKDNLHVFGPDTIVLTLQNGLGNVEAIKSVIEEKNVIAGTTAHGATMLEPGHILHAGSGKTIIGELNGKLTERIKLTAGLLERAGLNSEISNNVVGLIWDKLLVNVGINALTALTGLYNGQLVEHPELESILHDAVMEAVTVAKAKSIIINTADPVQHTKEVCKATAKNKSSMLQDITNHKRTEIDMINGAVVREGIAAGIPTPVNATLTNLVLFKQKSSER